MTILGLGLGIGFSRKAGSGSAFAAPSSPRLQVTNVTPSFTDSAFVTSVQGQHTAKEDVERSFAQNESFTFNISGGIASPGAAFYWNFVSTAVPGALFEYSDNAGSSWTTVANNMFWPSGDASTLAAAGRGQICYMPAASASRLYRITPNTLSATAITLNFGWRQLTGNDEIMASVGNSTWLSGARDPRNMRAKAKAVNSAFDPIWLCWNRGGSDPVDCYNEELVAGFAAHPYVKAVVGDMSLGQQVTNYHPIGTNPTADAAAFAQVQTNIQYVLGKSAKFYWTGVNFRAYDATNPPVVTSSNLDDGVRPYNKYVFDNYVRTLAPYNVNSTYDLPQIDFYDAIYADSASYLNADGIHLQPAGDIQTQTEATRAFAHFYTGSWSSGTQVAKRLIDGLGASTTTAAKAKVQAVLDGLYATSDATGLAGRAALQSQLTAIPTGYTDQTLTGGAVHAKDLSGVFFAFDFRNFDQGWSDTTETTAISNGLTAARWRDASSNAYRVQQTSTTPRPTWNATVGPDGRGAVVFDGADVLVNVDAALASCLDPANQPFTFIWIERSDVAAARDVAGIGPGGFFAGQNVVSTVTVAQAQVGVATVLNEASTRLVSKTLSGWYGYILVYDGTTETIYSSDGKVTSAAKAKAASTGTAFRIGGRYNTANWLGAIQEETLLLRAISTTEVNNVLAGFAQKGCLTT